MSPYDAVSWIIFGGGVMLLVGGIATFLSTRAFVSSAARTDATVVVTEEVLKNSADGTPSNFKAKVWVAEFKDRKGLAQRFHLGTALDVKLAGIQLGQEEDGALPPAGSKVALLFNPANPVQVRRDTFRDLWRIPAICAAMGIFCVAAAVFMRMTAP